MLRSWGGEEDRLLREICMEGSRIQTYGGISLGLSLSRAPGSIFVWRDLTGVVTGSRIQSSRHMEGSTKGFRIYKLLKDLTRVFTGSGIQTYGWISLRMSRDSGSRRKEGSNQGCHGIQDLDVWKDITRVVTGYRINAYGRISLRLSRDPGSTHMEGYHSGCRKIQDRDTWRDLPTLSQRKMTFRNRT